MTHKIDINNPMLHKILGQDDAKGVFKLFTDHASKSVLSIWTQIQEECRERGLPENLADSFLINVGIMTLDFCLYRQENKPLLLKLGESLHAAIDEMIKDNSKRINQNMN